MNVIIKYHQYYIKLIIGLIVVILIGMGLR